MRIRSGVMSWHMNKLKADRDIGRNIDGNIDREILRSTDDYII